MAFIHHSCCPLCTSRDIKWDFDVLDRRISGETFSLWRCGNCNFLFTQDPPAPQDAGRYYEGDDYISHQDTQEGVVQRAYHWARGVMLGRKKGLIDMMANGKRLLDYGAGTGYFVDYMKRAGYVTTGIEIDADSRAIAAEKFGVKIQAPEYLEASMTEDSVDVITLWHVLEHLYEPQDYLAQFARVLAPDGVLIIAVPNNASTDARTFGPYWDGYDVPRHIWHFTPPTLAKMVATAGFKVVDTQAMPFDPFYVSIRSARYRSGNKGLITGAVQGLRSYVRALTDDEKGSAIIYVCERT